MSPMKEWFVYILKNPRGIFYTGITKDIERRITEHNNGCGAKFTRGRGPWKPAYREGPLTQGEALKREREIKALRKKQKAALIEK